MSSKKTSKLGKVRAIVASFLVLIGLLTGVSSTVISTNDVYAVPNGNETTVINEENTTNDNTNEAETTTDDDSDKSGNTSGDNCKKSLGALGWVVCPSTGKISEAVDWLYDKIEQFLVVSPISTEDGSPIYEIWKYCRGITNIVFIIFLLVVIYSQITGLGISNYGIKKALPKLIVTAVLVNLSFLICSLAVDVSNIVGNSLRGVFTSIEESTLATSSVQAGSVTLSSMFSALVNGGALTLGAGAIAFEFGMIWMLIPIALGAIVAVVTGLITIALRQAVVALLIMISPLAMVAYMLPNTEQWFKKWKDLLTRMLVFYPMFSLLFGASSLAGFAIIMSAKDGFGLLLGVAVQIFPLFFAWKLMQMSGTFLGGINAKLRGLADKPLATNRALADSHRRQTSANFLAFGRTPSSHLRRYVDNRRALREKNIENLETIRKNQANVYTQRKISGYDGSTALGTSKYLNANKYTKTAKEASTSNLLSETATMDAVHALSNYGDYYVDKDVRDRIKAAEKAGNKTLVEQIKASDAESRRNAKAANAFLEYSRAQMTAENDNEADFNFMVSQFLGASMNYDPNDEKIDKEKMEKYRHYIVSSAGGLGETGQTRVLGKIIARAAAVESNQRRDIGIVAAKFPPDKRNFRNFLFNYYIDDDGYATDKEGNRIEEMRDYLRVHRPQDLVKWDQYDEENGPYFDWYDVNGNYVTRIYKKDSSAIKELMSNCDTPINDPINNMLAIHAGIKEQPNSEIPVLRHMGLDKFRTTVGRALLAAPFKEKNAAFSPMVAEMVKKGYIKNYAQENLAYLDSLNKATKPGNFNTQDADAIEMFANMMDPEKWEELFPEELIRGYLNVNGEKICGYKLDEKGNVMLNAKGKPIKVANEDATYAELMGCVKKKYLIPAAKKIAVMMSRQTQNTMDNQKAGTAEKWKELKEVLDTKWGEGKMMEVDPYKQDGDMREIARDIRGSLYTVDKEGNRHSFIKDSGRSSSGRSNKTRTEIDTNLDETPYVNYGMEAYEIYNRALDADDFAVSFSEYCKNYPKIAWIADQLQDYIVGEGYGVTKDQLYEKVEELLAYIDVD